MGKQGLYKYEYEGQVIYIGKSDASVAKRIADHKREAKFQPYLKNGVNIYTCELPNSTETELVEKALINQYKPILNGTNNQEGFSKLIKIEEPEWVLFVEDGLKAEKLNELKTNKSKMLPLFPKELVNIPYIGIEQVKEGRTWHEELVIAPNGRIEMPGFKAACEEDLTFPNYLYPTITFRFYDEIDNKHEENVINWIWRDIKKIEYNPSDILESLKDICELVLLHDKNFGSVYILKLSTKENDGLLGDLLNSGVDVDHPEVHHSNFSLSFGSEHFKDGTHEYHINKSNLFDIYIALLAATPEKLRFDWLLQIYFRITPPKGVSKHDIENLLRISGQGNVTNKHEVINKIRNQIGGEYREEWSERMQKEYESQVHYEYTQYESKAYRYLEQARFLILTKNHAYVIGKGDDDYIIAAIKQYGDNTPLYRIWAEKEIIDSNSSDFEYYPEIYLFPDDYKEWFHESREIGIINAIKGVIWDPQLGLIELPWHMKKGWELRDIVLEAYKVMIDRGF